jgi:MFS transporter, ACS family, hexuronate transporter
VSRSPDAARFRWLALSVFVLSTAINYLDRQTLATVAPLLRAEFRLSNTGFGLILTAFSITYAASAPFAGLLIDRIGLNRAISYAVALWSATGFATGLTRGAGSLVACRAVLGLAESAGIPGAGKAIHEYLKPAERALGNAVNQGGVSLGMMLAPPVATFLALRGGWRQAFFVTGLLGFAWIPLWNWVARRTSGWQVESGTDPKSRAPAPLSPAPLEILRDPRLWTFVAANALSMVGYSLWTNWTTLYLVDVHRLTLAQAAWYAWIPPVFAVAGGVAGGGLSLRFVERGVAPAAARRRVCQVASILALAAAAIPLAPTPAWACAGISLSIFAVAAFSVNMYSLPLDVFGGARAAFAVSILVASYGAAQALLSPAFGKIIDLYGYAGLAAGASLTPLIACWALWRLPLTTPRPVA